MIQLLSLPQPLTRPATPRINSHATIIFLEAMPEPTLLLTPPQPDSTRIMEPASRHSMAAKIVRLAFWWSF